MNQDRQVLGAIPDRIQNCTGKLKVIRISGVDYDVSGRGGFGYECSILFANPRANERFEAKPFDLRNELGRANKGYELGRWIFRFEGEGNSAFER
jgi:hypothetical protein